jgi:uncharacterized glyoxalase superfamily protein PhnB
MRYGNCLTYAIWMRITEGGSIRWSKSRTWWGFHTTWVDPYGYEWEYTIPTPKRHPWWYMPIIYRGVVKEVK